MMQQLSCSCMLLLITLCCGLKLKAQDSSRAAFPLGYLPQVSERASRLQSKLDQASEKALAQLQKREEKLKRKLYKFDSTKAKEIFGDAQQKYNALQTSLQQPGAVNQYIPYLDTLKTSLHFLQKNEGLLAGAKDADKQLANTLSKVKELESSLAGAEKIKRFLKERKEYLKSQLSGFPLGKELKKINQQAYYYSAQVAQYKQALKDPKKLERKAIELLSKTKPFQEFMRKHSELASLFRLPGSDDDLSSGAALRGLQTRASVNALIQDRIGNNADAQAIFRQNLQDAQSQLSGLKEKAGQYTSGSFGNGGDDMEMPDFKPNTQKTRSFLQRLEYGGNVQSQRARHFFPVTSDLGLSLGYKLNDKSVVGIGASYKLGLGKGWQNIALSNQGVGLRSYVDYKLKGSIFLSGGYEQNYRTAFASIEELKDGSAWQSSGLIGLSKKYSVSKKMKGSVQLLWDFLSYQQVPKTQAVLFRVGYSLK